MTILRAWPIDLSTDEIIRGQGMDSQIVHAEKPLLLAAAERAKIEGISLLHPLAIIQEIGIREHRHNRIVLEDDFELTGALVTSHLGNAQKIYASICTIGKELETVVSDLLEKDPLYALAMDGLGNATVESLSQQICAHIGEQILAGAMTASAPLTPGNPGWPVEIGQSEIFALLDPSRCGITLTTGGMMVPKKSMSFVVGIGPEMPTTDMCVICNLKNTCRFQHG